MLIFQGVYRVQATSQLYTLQFSLSLLTKVRDPDGEKPVIMNMVILSNLHII